MVAANSPPYVGFFVRKRTSYPVGILLSAGFTACTGHEAALVSNSIWANHLLGSYGPIHVSSLHRRLRDFRPVSLGPVGGTSSLAGKPTWQPPKTKGKPDLKDDH